ncbi:MAG: CocE/NonD family hydrolase, partial [Mycobacteriaceae bacterium]
MLPPSPANPITVNPTLTFSDAIVLGNTNAVDAKGLPLAYTVVAAPSQGGKITFIRPTDTPVQPAGTFSYLPYATVLTGTTEQFSMLVSETTPFDTALRAALKNLPALGSRAASIINDLHQAPVLGTVLAPIIGYAVSVPFSSADVPQLTQDVPVAFTYKVISFDGTPISTNFFPAAGLTTGESAPTILAAAGLAIPGNTNPLSEFLGTNDRVVPGIKPLRDAGYNVVTWDPRGEFASGGVLQLNNPFYEGRDVSAIITWTLDQPATETNQRIGMVGASYGGAIQLVSAGIDPRIDAIVPSITYNSLNGSLDPNGVFKTAWTTLLVYFLEATKARINEQLYTGTLIGDLFGVLTQSFGAVLASSGPTVLVNKITAPTLLIQGTADVLFPLQQAVDNAATLSANGIPVKMVWFCGGHNTCLNPGGGNRTTIINDTMAWLDQYVKEDGTPADGIPTFEWQDQTGQSYTSPSLPSDPAFYGTPITVTGAGGILPIISLLGGSGPERKAAFPQARADGAPAKIAVNVPLNLPATPTHIVGAPTLSFAYSGIGTSRAVYAQIVDTKTGLVLGFAVTPIPVTLNGKTQTATVELNDITFTTNGEPLTLQIVGAPTMWVGVAGRFRGTF